MLQGRSLVMWSASHLGMAYRVPTPKHGLTGQQVRELTWDRREWYRRRVSAGKTTGHGPGATGHGHRTFLTMCYFFFLFFPSYNGQ